MQTCLLTMQIWLIDNVLFAQLLHFKEPTRVSESAQKSISDFDSLMYCILHNLL